MYIHNLRDNIEKYERKENETFFGVFAIPLLILTLIISSIVWLFLPNSAEAVWFDSNWTYKVPVEINPNKVGTTTAITSFPVYLNLADLPSSFFTNAKSDGCDVRVLESDEATETAFELVSYSAGGTGELHFMADSLSTTSTSTFYVYYGNSGASCYAATDTYGKNAVWSAYGGVWHLNSASTDSTSNANNGTDSNVTYVSAKLGTGASGNGSNTEIDVGSNSSIQTTTNMSTSIWVNMDSTVDAYTFSQTKPTSPYGRWVIYLASDSKFNFNLLNSGGGQSIASSGAYTYSTGTWYHVVGTISGTSMAIYVNGILRGTSSFAGTRSNTTGNITMFQRDVDGVGDTAGDLDEVRYIKSALSASWVLTEYNNQSSPTTFYSIGTEQTEGGVGGALQTPGLIWFD